LTEADATVSLLRFFTNKQVQLTSGGYAFRGKLLSVERLSASSHPPIVFIVKTGRILHIIRGWTLIGQETREKQ